MDALHASIASAEQEKKPPAPNVKQRNAEGVEEEQKVGQRMIVLSALFDPPLRQPAPISLTGQGFSVLATRKPEGVRIEAGLARPRACDPTSRATCVISRIRYPPLFATFAGSPPSVLALVY
jgi:hypothetical protein